MAESIVPRMVPTEAVSGSWLQTFDRDIDHVERNESSSRDFEK